MASHFEWDYSLTWKISEFSLCYPKILSSPSFTVAALEDSKWFLTFYTKSLLAEYMDFVSCYLTCIKNNESDKAYALTYKILMILDETYICHVTRKNIKIKNDCAHAIHSFYRRDNLIAKMKKSVTHSLTLRCLIKGMPEVFRDPERREVHTLIVKHKSVVPWKVKFTEGNLNTDEETKFCLDDSFFKINLAVLQDNFNIVITSISLKNSSSLFPVTGKVILYANGRELLVVDHVHMVFGNGTNGFVIPSLISIQQLRDNGSACVNDGRILLIFNFSSFSDVVSTPVSEVTGYTVLEKYMNYYFDFSYLSHHEKSKNVILRIDKNNEHSVHKSVLVSRSPVFYAMFNHDTIENQTGIVNLVDIDAETLEYFLNFLYTDVFPISGMNCEKAAKLLILADRYRVRSLIQESVNFLTLSLTNDNVLDVLVLADKIHQTRLKKTCINFAAHHQTEIFSTDLSNWTQENVELYAEICESV